MGSSVAVAVGAVAVVVLIVEAFLGLFIWNRRAHGTRELDSLLKEFGTELEDLRSSMSDMQAGLPGEQAQSSAFGYLLSEANPDNIFSGLVEALRQRMQADAAGLFVSAPDEDSPIRAVAALDEEELAGYLALMPLRPALGTAVAMRYRSSPGESRSSANAGWSLALPLALEVKGAVATLLVLWRARREEPSDEQVRTLYRLAGDALAVIEAAFRLNRMQRLVITDHLTGLYNRRYFDETLEREVDRARRYERQLSLVILDVDKFKTINDTLGHANGDAVLKVVAKAIKQTVRAADVACRLGGDEFAILLPEISLAEADQFYERLKRAVQGHQPFLDRPLTISAGIAELLTAEEGASLLDRADAALLAAKRVQ